MSSLPVPTPFPRNPDPDRCIPDLGNCDLILTVYVPDGASLQQRRDVFQAFAQFIEDPTVLNAMPNWSNFVPMMPPQGGNLREIIIKRLTDDAITVFSCGNAVQDAQDYYCIIYDPVTPNQPIKVCYHEFDLLDGAGKVIELKVPGFPEPAWLRIVIRYVFVV